ncbi:type I-F CRISPR-associated endoribonuclease Cas6/Csy4 [Mitsuokella multacida]|uniref:type I-F CRISPR-associated endoribonuclease Cas6/Csy4 n=1 Tax=Mitsuokella multacida TaxID=52226 RepID=UPI0022E4C24A|nr:type I-F CRISPR-associated endoribonuclease Cas6/Csy4 [Mitsuokella multacida]
MKGMIDMWFFQDVILQPTEDIATSFLWSRVYRQIHLALVSSKDEQGMIRCGVAFPGYSDVTPTLGRTLRLLALEESDLQRLNLIDALKRFTPDYVKVKSICPVPVRSCKGFVTYSRYQPEATIVQKARRYAKRHNISIEEAQKLFPTPANETHYPYIQLESMTNHHRFSLFIQKKEADEHPYEGFSAYGFSKRSSVPDF